MSDLPRYRLTRGFSMTNDQQGQFVKWADVSARLQQLEAEKESLQQICDSHAAHADEYFQNWERLVIRVSQLKDERTELRAALAETRDALHQFTEKYESLVESQRESLTRGDGL